MNSEVVNQAIDYIMEHIGEEITVEDVAEHCHFSKYYFSRVFKAETGESVYGYIKRIKLEQSAFKLKIERGRTIMDIGMDYGYSPSNYSTVFKQYHKETPADFRRGIFEKSVTHPFYHAEQVRLKTLAECKKLISVETLPDRHVIYERSRGNYHDIGAGWDSFLEKYDAYRTGDTVLIERTFDDPVITDVDNCMYDLCMSVSEDCDLSNTTVIQGGKFAIYHFTGHPQEIYGAYQSFFNVWFPQSGYELDDRLNYDIYKQIDCENGIFEMEFCVPVK